MSIIAFLATRLHVPPWLVELTLAALLIFGYTLYERHQGAKSCVSADKLAVAKDEQQAAVTYQAGVTTVFQEDSQYDAAIHAPVEHPVHVSLCKPSGPRPATQDSTPAGQSDAAPALSGASAGDSVSGDVGPALQAIGRDADAQVNALRDYITKVCVAR